MSFLKAEWRKLALANYSVEPHILEKYLPYGTELDLWQGKCYVSLVGFMFKNTKLLGVKVLFHVNFEEVNLRFYVKRKENNEWKRGVLFVKEIVPKKALTFIANTFYNENYETMPMKHRWDELENSLTVTYEWEKEGKSNLFQVQADKQQFKLEPGSETEFITEHYWGYAKVNEQKTTEYEVTHPHWQVYQVNDYKIEADFGAIYGANFEFLNHQTPTSVMLAEGSKTTVEGKKRLEHRRHKTKSSQPLQAVIPTKEGSFSFDFKFNFILSRVSCFMFPTVILNLIQHRILLLYTTY